MTSDHVVHVVVLAQVELQQVNLDFTVFDKHAVFDNLGDRGGGVKECRCTRHRPRRGQTEMVFTFLTMGL